MELQNGRTRAKAAIEFLRQNNEYYSEDAMEIGIHQRWTSLLEITQLVTIGTIDGELIPTNGPVKITTWEQAMPFITNSIKGLVGEDDLADYIQQALPEEEWLSFLFLELEFLKFLARLLDLALAASRNKSHVLFQKVKSEQVKNARAEIDAEVTRIRQFATGWVKNLEKDSKKSMMAALYDNERGRALESIVGRQFAESCIARWRDSAMDSVNGLLKIKVP